MLKVKIAIVLLLFALTVLPALLVVRARLRRRRRPPE